MKIIKETTSKKIFPYIAWVPENCGEHPALIVHLHGAGERGNGGEELDKVTVWGFPNIADDENLQNVVLLMPQCPPESFWAGRVESLKTFIDTMAEEFAVDKDRIYLCGLSMGGFGTWYTAMAYPEMFAAIAPCCGGGMAWNAGVLTMPIRTFHGLEDNVVSPHQTMEMIDALKDKHPDFGYELYEGVGHDSWKRAFSPELLAWMLAQHK